MEMEVQGDEFLSDREQERSDQSMEETSSTGEETEINSG